MLKIETSRLILREYEPNDWKAVHVYAQQAEVLQYEAWGPDEETHTKAFIENCIRDSKHKPRNIFELCITLKEGGRLIGGCGFRIRKSNRQRGNFGYIVNPDFWNKGYATEAALGLLNHMIQNHGIKQIDATCDTLNLASQRVLEKCGLEKVEEIKEDMEMKGRIRDTYVYEKW